MIYRIYRQIFLKSPWDDQEENIFTKNRKKSQFNFDDFQFNFNSFNKFSKKSIVFALIVIGCLWLASGVYEIKEGEEAAVIRFGKYNRTGLPGLNYHLPSPFEIVDIEKVNQSRRIEIGYRSTGRTNFSGGSSTKDITSESIMLTGDENIVELNADVMWHISSLHDYLFNVINPEETVKSVAESAIREVVSNTPIAFLLSSQKQEITEKIEKLIQSTLLQYKIGVVIEQVQLLRAEPPAEVIQAYRDVQTSKADKEKEINQAQAYNNDVLPRARGESAKILQEAEGYAASVIAKAKGDASRFNSIYVEYVQNKDITKNRLYLEALEAILQDANKVIMGGGAVLPHMAIGSKDLLNKE
jgi:membrane protease subunit HflK